MRLEDSSSRKRNIFLLILLVVLIAGGCAAFYYIVQEQLTEQIFKLKEGMVASIKSDSKDAAKEQLKTILSISEGKSLSQYCAGMVEDSKKIGVFSDPLKYLVDSSDQDFNTIHKSKRLPDGITISDTSAKAVVLGALLKKSDQANSIRENTRMQKEADRKKEEEKKAQEAWAAAEVKRLKEVEERRKSEALPVDIHTSGRSTITVENKSEYAWGRVQIVLNPSAEDTKTGNNDDVFDCLIGDLKPGAKTELHLSGFSNKRGKAFDSEPRTVREVLVKGETPYGKKEDKSLLVMPGIIQEK
jgi:hypothetical protein